MADKTIEGKDTFFDYICWLLARSAFPKQTMDDSVLIEIINSDHCPIGYRGVNVFVKETELKKYLEDEK